ncbi:hypothetical protein CCP3SC15_180016 [Gammaproteobacteria bacterium]
MRLPALHIAWWDTTKDQSTSLEWQSPEITVPGATETSVPSKDLGGISAWLLALPAAAVFFLLGWWIGRGQPGTTGLAGLFRRILTGWHRIGERLRPVAVKLTQQAEPVYRATLVFLHEHLGKHLKGPLASFAPRPLATRFHRFLERILPTTFHTRRLLHHIQAAGNVEAIAEALGVYAVAALALPRHSPLAMVAEAMVTAHPELDSPSLLQLFHQLDTALYGEAKSSSPNLSSSQPGDGEGVDIGRWKQNFREIVRPLRHHSRRTPTIATQGLPPLNPGSENSTNSEPNVL